MVEEIEIEERVTTFNDSFSIGTSATGGVIKVYFDILDTENTDKKITEAIRLWKNACVVSGRGK